MRFLLALMAGTVALSAQADIKPCIDKKPYGGCELVWNVDTGSIETFIELKKVAQFFDGSNGNLWYDDGSLSPGEFIPFSLLENAKFEIVQGDMAKFLNLPKGSCEQYYLLAAFYLDRHNSKSEPYNFYKNKLEKKCPKTYWFNK